MTTTLKAAYTIARITTALLLLFAIGFKVLSAVVMADVKKEAFSVKATVLDDEKKSETEDKSEKLQELAKLNQGTNYCRPGFTTVAHQTAYQNSYTSLYCKLITIPPPDLT